MTYALPSNISTIGGYGDWVNVVDPNFFGILLFGIFLIVLIGLRASPNLSTPIAVTTSSFVTLLASLLLLIAGWVGAYIPIMYLVGLVIGMILLIREGGM